MGLSPHYYYIKILLEVYKSINQHITFHLSELGYYKNTSSKIRQYKDKVLPRISVKILSYLKLKTLEKLTKLQYL